MKAVRKLQDLSHPVKLFLILAILTTLICGLIFVTSQQIYRQSANDPQIQISEDMAAYLSSGQDVKAVMPKTDVEISKSLVWFIMVFNNQGEVIASNARLNAHVPIVPKGVLDFAKQNGQNRVTWEPEKGVRIASVITSYNDGTVLIGRSLRETENRVMILHKKILITWVVMLVITFLATHFLIPKKSN